MSTSKTQKREIARRLHSGCLRLLRRLRNVDQQLGMSTARMSVLSVLVFGEPRSLTDLAKIEQVSKPTMSNLIKGLVDDGYLYLKPSKDDRRVSIAYASAKGKKLLVKGQSNRVEALLAMIEDLSHEELQSLELTAELFEQILQSGG